MRYLILASVASAYLVAVPSIASAGPNILALNVKASCSIQNGTFTNVSLNLNSATGSFYGTGLFYHFVANPDGTSVTRPTPSPSSVPVRLAVAPGHYRLAITNNAAPGVGSSSAEYLVAVPAFHINAGSRRVCPAKLSKDRLGAHL